MIKPAGIPNYTRLGYDVMSLASRLRFYRANAHAPTGKVISGSKRVGVLYDYQITRIAALTQSWLTTSQTMINHLRGVIDPTPYYEIDPIYPVDDYAPDNFGPQQEPSPGWNSQQGAPAPGFTPLGKTFPIGGPIKPGGGGGILPLPRPRPWPKPVPWPWPPWPLPPPPGPMTWIPHAEQDYSYICAYKALMDLITTKEHLVRSDFRNLAEFMIGMFQHFYELHLFRRGSTSTQTMCIAATNSLRNALFK